MDDPIARMAAFHSAYGIAPLDVRERPEAVSTVTHSAAACAERSEQLTQALWALLADLEAGASDEVLLTGFERVGLALAQALLELYGTAQLLGVSRVAALMQREYEARMSALSARGYRQARAGGLVALPGV